MEEQLLSIIANEESKLLNHVSHSDRMCILGSIINIKKELILRDIKNVDIYIDLKKYIKENIHAIDENKFEYDDVRKGFIKEILIGFPDRQKLRIYKYMKKELVAHGFTDSLNWCINEIRGLEHIIAYEDGNYFKWATYKIASSLTSIIVFLLFVTLLCTLILMPAPIEAFSAYNMEYDNYCDNKIINHFLNVICVLFGSANKGKITPTTPLGVISLLVGKIVLIVIVINFIIKEVERRLDL